MDSPTETKQNFYTSKAYRRYQNEQYEALFGVAKPEANFALIDGKVMRYDLMGELRDIEWPDLVFLGSGTWHHAEDWHMGDAPRQKRTPRSQ